MPHLRLLGLFLGLAPRILLLFFQKPLLLFIGQLLLQLLRHNPSGLGAVSSWWDAPYLGRIFFLLESLLLFFLRDRVFHLEVSVGREGGCCTVPAFGGRLDTLQAHPSSAAVRAAPDL